MTRTLGGKAAISPDLPGPEVATSAASAVANVANRAVAMAMAHGLGPDDVHAVATSAIREANNGERFLKAARAASGLHIEVISDDQEARFGGVTVAEDAIHQNLPALRLLVANVSRAEKVDQAFVIGRLLLQRSEQLNHLFVFS